MIWSRYWYKRVCVCVCVCVCVKYVSDELINHETIRQTIG